MTKGKFKAWSVAILTVVMLMYVLPQLPFVWGILGLAALCILVFRR
jgi:hypothetical protein